MNYFDFKGQVAVIFGASSGIGAATAVAYAEHGAKVVIVARRLGKLEELKAKIEANGGEVLAIECDVISEESVKNADRKSTRLNSSH